MQTPAFTILLVQAAQLPAEKAAASPACNYWAPLIVFGAFLLLIYLCIAAAKTKKH